jgi:hypothetical protein
VKTMINICFFNSFIVEMIQFGMLCCLRAICFVVTHSSGYDLLSYVAFKRFGLLCHLRVICFLTPPLSNLASYALRHLRAICFLTLPSSNLASYSTFERIVMMMCRCGVLSFGDPFLDRMAWYLGFHQRALSPLRF